MGPPPGGIEPVPGREIVPRAGHRQADWEWFGRSGTVTADQSAEDEQVTDWSGQVETIRRHWVTLASLALIAGSLAWKADFLARNFFRQDDYHTMDIARRSALSWGFLTHFAVGHFFPGVWASAWVLSRVALYNWTAASAEVLVFTAAASLAAWRMLRTLLGNRPALLIPLTLYVLTPLWFPSATWWINAAEEVPLQIALFMALTSHVHYVRTGRIRHAVAAACWLLFGLLFFEKSALIPVLLFAVTAGFLVRRRQLPGAIKLAAVQFWKAWLLYFGLLFAYLIVFFASLHTSGTQPTAPPSAGALGTFSWYSLARTFIPGSLGGPWHWLHFASNGDSAYSVPPTALYWLALLVALAVVAGSILTRSRAWRGWAILAGWLLVADMAPVAIGRLLPNYAGLLGESPRYVADAAGVLVIVLALVFWPLADPASAGERRQARYRSFFRGRWQTAAVALVTVFAVGSVWSVSRLTDLLDSMPRTYVTNATAALAQAQAGTLILDQHVPYEIMERLFKADAADTSVVLGPLSHRGAAVRWITTPSGLMSGPLMVFGNDGRLYPAAVLGVTATPRPVCLRPGHPNGTVALPAISPDLKSKLSTLRLSYEEGTAYRGSPVTVTYGFESQTFTLPPGVGTVYMPALGSAPAIQVHATVHAGSVCVFKVAAGYFGPGLGDVIPATSAG